MTTGTGGSAFGDTGKPTENRASTQLQLLSELAWDVDKLIEAIPYTTRKLQDSEPTEFLAVIVETGETVYERPLVQ